MSNLPRIPVSLSCCSLNKVIVTALFMMSLMSSGQVVNWEAPIRAGSYGRSVAHDSSGSMIFAGTVNNEVANQTYFNDYPLSVYPYYSTGYVIKTDINFNIIWAKDIISSNFGRPLVMIDNEDNIILTGNFRAFVTIDATQYFIPADEIWALLVKLDKDGNLIWLRTIKGSYSTFRIVSIKKDQDNNIYVGGQDTESVRFYNGDNELDTIAGEGNSLVFFAKYDNDGNFKWVKTAPQDHNQCGLEAMEIDIDNNIYLTGFWASGGTFDSINKISPSGDIFIAKYNQERQLQWLKQIGASSNTTHESGYGLAIDNELEQLYVTGGFVGTADFGDSILQSNDKNIFLASYNFDGQLNWVKNMGMWSGAASYIEYGYHLLVDNEGFLYLTGEIGQNGDIDGIAVSAYDDPGNGNKYFDPFVAKFVGNGKVIWADHLGHPDGDDDLFSLIKTGNKVTIAGHAKANAIFGDYTLQSDDNYSLGYVCNLVETSNTILEINPDHIFMDDNYDLSSSFKVFSNTDWVISVSEGWLSLDSMSGKGNCLVSFLCEPNLGSSLRTCNINISAQGVPSKSLTVYQYKSGTGTEDLFNENGRVKIYPNPARDYIYFVFMGKYYEQDPITVIDLTGRIVIQSSIRNSRLDISQLEPGVYFLVLNYKNIDAIWKFIKVDDFLP